MIKFILFSMFILFTQWLTHLIIKRTPKYSKEDKKIPIYHATSLGFVSMMVFFFGLSIEALKGIVLCHILLYASVSDIQTHRVKDCISVMIILTGLIGVSLTDLPLMLLSGFIVFLFLFICAFLSNNKLGGADVKLSAACAFLLGFQKGMAGIVIGLFLAVVLNLIMNRKSGQKAKAFPLVPYLSAGFTAMYFF